MPVKFKIAETYSFASKLRGNEFKSTYNKINNYIYPQLRENPFFGPNIKKLKGKYDSLYRYRIGRYRLIYTIDTEKELVFMIEIDQRKDIYKR